MDGPTCWLVSAHVIQSFARATPLNIALGMNHLTHESLKGMLHIQI
jgi:type IV secretory pathway TrbD component